MERVFFRSAWAVRLLLAAASCAIGSAAQAADAAPVTADTARCAALTGVRLPASDFGLPTGGAVIGEAKLMPADAATGLPEFCRVRGDIEAAQAGGLPIKFQVNLPTRWNQKTVQYGGGGFNGVVIEATWPFAGGGGAVLPALAHGYVTYGSDSGHQTTDRGFFLNPQAFANYAHEAVKRSRDLSGALVRRYYGRDARRNYHIGGSKGGHEALQAVQRYHADFDGAVSYFPAAQIQTMQLGWNRLWHYAFKVPGGALNKAEQAMLKTAVMARCDALDGATDGIVSDVAGCGRSFDPASLRCPEGADTGDACFSDPQIAALKVAASRFDFAHPMPSGMRSVGPWPVLIGGEIELWFGDGVDGSQQEFYRFNASRPEALSSSGIDPAAWRASVDLSARTFDAVNPDLDALRAKGGKLILVQGTTDMLVPESMTTAYFETLSARYGKDLRRFARYYVVPGYGHGEGAFTVQWDSLAALDRWVETGAAPVQPIAADGGETTRGRTRPLCEHPAWPKYKGRGDVDRAESFTCVVSRR